jgi:hypothetical protein
MFTRALGVVAVVIVLIDKALYPKHFNVAFLIGWGIVGIVACFIFARD